MSTERFDLFETIRIFILVFSANTRDHVLLSENASHFFLRSDYSTGDVGEAGGEENNKDIGGGGGGVGQTVPDDFDEVRTSSIRHIISNGLS